MRTLIGIWMVCAFAWKARFYTLELQAEDGNNGWVRYFAEYVAAAIHSSWVAVGLWLMLGRWL